MHDAVAGAGGELRIVGQRGARSDHDGVGARPQPVHEGAGRGAGDPTRFAAGRGDPAVEGRSELERDEGTSAGEDAEEAPMLRAALRLENARLDPDAGRAQAAQPEATDQGIRIPVPHEDAADAGGHDGLAARAGATHVGARLEGDGEAGAPERPSAPATFGGAQRDDFGVRSAGRARVAAPQDAIATEDDGADGRVGERPARCAPRRPDRHAHGHFRLHLSRACGPARALSRARVRHSALVGFVRRPPADRGEEARVVLRLLEAVEDRGEARRRHGVEADQLLHHPLAEIPARDLPLAGFLQALLDAVEETLDRQHADGALLAGALDPREQLGALVVLATLVAFHDLRAAPLPPAPGS